MGDLVGMEEKTSYHPVITGAGFVIPDEFAEEYEAQYGNDAWLHPELAAELVAERLDQEELRQIIVFSESQARFVKRLRELSELV